MRHRTVSLHAHLDVVCSMRQVGVDELHNAGGVWYYASCGIPTVSSHRERESTPRTPNSMFEIIRRNLFYHVLIVARHPEKRVLFVNGQTTAVDLRTL